MGLSASQARLLSITARLTDNEYHSQQIANAKTRLAAKGTEAREEYQRALDSKVLIYNGFDTQGNATSTILTPNVIYQYQPLKNQYALINTSNQILVNSVDATNFEETSTLGEFLERYDLVSKSATTVKRYKDDVEEILNPAYDDAWDKWQKEWDERLKDYNDKMDEIENWEEREKPKEEWFTITTYEYEYGESEESQSLYEMFRKASKSCFENATEGLRTECYEHVLAHMLDLTLDKFGEPIDYPKTFITTINQLVWTDVNDINGSAIYGDGMTPYMKPVSDVIRDGWTPPDGGPVQTLYAAEHPVPADPSSAPESELYISAYYISQPDPSDDQKLLSNYKKDSSGQIVQKTLREKCVDLLYALSNASVSYEDVMIPLIKSFQDDMDVLLKGISIKVVEKTETDRDEYEQALEEWENEQPPEVPEYPEEPEKPTEPRYLYKPVTVPYYETEWIYEVADPEKSQWYTNLWYRMNGLQEPEKIKTKDGYEDNMDYYRKYILDTLKAEKNVFSASYQVLDPHLASSSTWLEDVLSQGIVVMQRVANDNTDFEEKLNWKEIIYTDASELTIETDDNAIAKAEVVYKEKMHQIEAKDKRYQLEINKLDSEHNALQTQIDSIKSEVSKNIERSFKTFS